MRTRIPCVALLLFIFLPSFASAQSPAAREEADALFQARKWADAARAYEAITKIEATNVRAWYRLGVALHSLGNYAQAVGAFQKALEIAKNPQAMYALAAAYARLNEKEKAFAWLNQALRAGFVQMDVLKNDPDLSSLRSSGSEQRFQELLSLGERLSKPCLYSPEYRQFDFWIGEWDVQINGQQVGTNSVQRILDGCVIFENWTSARGGTGKSFNFYDASTGRWQQTWVDNAGTVLNLTGEYKENALRYTGETPLAGGGKTLHRLTFFNLGPDRVRQFWEQSTDEGKTWKAVWDSIYIRKK